MPIRSKSARKPRTKAPASNSDVMSRAESLPSVNKRINKN